MNSPQPQKQYSTNPNSAKERKRRANKTGNEAALETLKHNYRNGCSNAKVNARKTPGFQDLSAAEKEQLEKDAVAAFDERT
jgi:hypothetical protein